MLEDGVCSMPVDIVWVREPMARERERLEKTLVVFIRVLQRAKNEVVPDRVVEGVLISPNEFLGGSVETVPFFQISFLVMVQLGELNIGVEARRGACPVSLRRHIRKE